MIEQRQQDKNVRKRFNPRTPAQRTASAEGSPTPAELARFKCNWLQFWRACEDKRCHRHGACSGDAQACFQRHWWRQSDDFRHLVQGTLKNMCERGLPYQEALNAAYAEALSFKEKEAEWDARDAERRAARTVSEPRPIAATPEPPMPRVRGT